MLLFYLSLLNSGPRSCEEHLHLQSGFYSREVVLATIALKIEAKFNGLRAPALVWRKKVLAK